MDEQKSVELFDTTLRDGSQSEDVLFSVNDKLAIVEALDHLKIDIIEGGWPGANPKDVAFFEQVKKLKLQHSRLAAFGSTRRAYASAEEDHILKALLEAETGVITIFGKSWDFHVTTALKITLEKNLELIHDSVRYLKKHTDMVIYDAEHFFDGFKNNPEYALKTLEAAQSGGADRLVLCDTNGGCLVHEVSKIVKKATQLDTAIGIHCHNDSGLAVANTLAAVDSGATHVQGTINGIGERCGNADLISVIPNLMLKMERQTSLQPEDLQRLTQTSRFVYEIMNRAPRKNQPYVGSSAFAHKGGIHVSAVLKNSQTYEHIKPEKVGNRQRVLVSEQAGRSNLVYKLDQFGIKDVEASDPRMQILLKEVKELEHKGYQFDGADASFELRVRKALGEVPDYFSLRGFRVSISRINELWAKELANEQRLVSDAAVKIDVHGQLEHTVSEGDGPINALDLALRKALVRFYPQLKNMHLEDFTVRIHKPVSKAGSDAIVRVLIQSHDDHESWGTVGVSPNIIAASYDALVDSVTYKLFKDGVKPSC
ncbi:citramalate synthase [Magnetococcales bacterium HHB-1]